jgi:hypothetical protein
LIAYIQREYPDCLPRVRIDEESPQLPIAAKQ